MEKLNPDVVEAVQLGETYERRPMVAIKVRTAWPWNQEQIYRQVFSHLHKLSFKTTKYGSTIWPWQSEDSF